MKTDASLPSPAQEKNTMTNEQWAGKIVCRYTDGHEAKQRLWDGEDKVLVAEITRLRQILSEAALSAAEPVDDEDNPRIGNFDIEEASIDDGAEIAKRLALPPQGQEVVTYTKLADALEACDWAGCSIGNKAVLLATVKELRNIAAADPSVAVKALEWHDRHDIPLRANDLLAESVVGQFAIRPSSAGSSYRLFMPWAHYNDAKVFSSVGEAKAAAQADYEARIRTALTAQAQDVVKTRVDDRHKFEPNRKYPWFCAICGYAPHEPLAHIPEAPAKQEVANVTGQ